MRTPDQIELPSQFDGLHPPTMTQPKMAGFWRVVTGFFPPDQEEPQPRVWNESLGYSLDVPPFLGGYVQDEGTVKPCVITLESGFRSIVRFDTETRFSVAIDGLNEELKLSRWSGGLYSLGISTEETYLRDLTRVEQQRYANALSTFTTEPPLGLTFPQGVEL